ncbi:PucR family transcriptional regulator ligand-binding domain-containing protein [Aquibacillus sp. 3ASR75-11]|uniref:PucR family transcriptional regulator ligand-binding domain-containing protein n=1 Tax=Terrihalobacillus insolitus TaxID=2950438 RepID=A0A9X3WYR4_9BACI|nr:PucR family transcriptional regulator [Terrihalobacillus insolitus]MDC3415065.1 PucR family transcriptional regulator ligand-binding domain-containing protein [Terrihalobacillus insolitus]MDC3425849.1 PucR family transcriptional regulator ligand-binding domain-containing protein [Terrihalobacillus insolitus]
MGLLVKDVVQLSVMETAKVKTGKDFLSEKQVEWISVIEVPVENFVRKNEFVLSTGIGCEDDPILLEKFVQDVIDSGATALAFATGRYIYDIPDRVLQLAEQHNFILIDIPWEVRFGDILQMVLQEINEDKQAGREQAEGVRQELINCVLQGKGLQEISELLFVHTKLPIAVIDETKTLRAKRSFDQEIIDALDQAAQWQKIPPSEVSYSDHPLYHHIEEFIINNKTCFQLSIMSNHSKQGYLLFQVDDRQQLNWFVMNVLEHALTACALYFVKENAIELTEIRLRDNFLLNLAKNHTEVTNQILSKAQLLGYDLSRPYLCIVGDIRFKDDTTNSQHTKDRPRTSSLQSMNYYFQKEITNAGNLLNRKTMTTFDEGEVIIFLEADHIPYMETSNQFLDIIERRLHELLTGIYTSWGIAAHKDGHYVFHESYEEARTALEIGMKQKGNGERTFFSDTRINRLLMALSHDTDIADIVKDTIQPLIQYDKKRQTDLIYTFMIYNKYKGNVSQTARALNLHRQSLLHRLRNIESLTQLSLVDSDDLFLLELSVRLWMLKKME